MNEYAERISNFVNKGWIMFIADDYVMWVHPNNQHLFIKVAVTELPLIFIV